MCVVVASTLPLQYYLQGRGELHKGRRRSEGDATDIAPMTSARKRHVKATKAKPNI
jgi:hypothetical protein